MMPAGANDPEFAKALEIFAYAWRIERVGARLGGRRPDRDQALLAAVA